MLDIKVWDDITASCQHEQLKDDVEKRQRLFYPIDTTEATTNLIHIKTLLEVSYSGSKNFTAGTNAVLDMLLTYGEAVKTAVRASTTSTNITIEALSFHKHALLFTEKGKPRKACAFLGKCGNLARQISEAYGTMIADTARLSAALKKGTAVFADTYTTEGDVRPFTQSLEQVNLYLDEVRRKADELREEVEKTKAKPPPQNPESKKSVKERLTYHLLCPISYVENISADIKSIQLKLSLQKDGKEFNNSLKQSVDTLAESPAPHNDIPIVLLCLRLAVELTEKVRRILLNSQRFWDAVEYVYETLPSSPVVEKLCDDDIMEVCKENFILEVQQSIIGWLTTGNMCRRAADQIRDVSHGLNRSRPQVLSGKECCELIGGLSGLLFEGCVVEEERLSDAALDCLYEIVMANVVERIQEEEEENTTTEADQEEENTVEADQEEVEHSDRSEGATGVVDSGDVDESSSGEIQESNTNEFENSNPEETEVSNSGEAAEDPNLETLESLNENEVDILHSDEEDAWEDSD